jgi:5-methylcytosine-specific restriction endonuclease McrA
MWAKDYLQCQACGTNSIPCEAKGLCRYCYHKRYAEEHRQELQKYKRRWYQENITPEMQRIQREERYFSGNRQKVLRRDRYRCIQCGESRIGKLTVHHRDKQGRNVEQSNNRLSNLETLCRSCHAKLHHTTGRWARHFDACISCGKTEKRHNAFGYCTQCYWKNR